MFGFLRSQRGKVLLRRKGALLGELQSDQIVRLIEGRKLSGQDRISKDGKTWTRLDRITKYKKLLASRAPVSPNSRPGPVL